MDSGDGPSAGLNGSGAATNEGLCPGASVMGRDPAISLRPLCPVRWLGGLPERCCLVLGDLPSVSVSDPCE
uniref:Uncharacterized protein n=1 Tax=Mustela putorius furo TaxID=9669 RepID=M3XYJ8_MUSPF